jgi:hypothetical protein
MRSNRVRHGILPVVALLAVPCSTLAQTTSTDAAIVELRQLLADQRAALDRQARIIEEQGRTLATLQERVEGVTPTTAAAAAGTQGPLSEQPASRTAAEPTPDLPAMVVSAGDFPGSIRIPGVGLQTRRPGAIGRGSHAERPRDGGSVRHLLDPGSRPATGRGSTHGLLAHRELLEHRAADAESEGADAPVHRNRLRRAIQEVECRVWPHRPDHGGCLLHDEAKALDMFAQRALGAAASRTLDQQAGNRRHQDCKTAQKDGDDESHRGGNSAASGTAALRPLI